MRKWLACLVAMWAWLCFAAPLLAAVHRVKGTVTKQGENQFLLLEDGSKLKIDRIGGRAQKTIAKSIESGEEKWVIYNDQGGRIMVTWVDNELPLTPEQQKMGRQKQKERLLGVGDAAMKEFVFIPDGYCTPRGKAAVGDKAITQQLPLNTGRPGSQTSEVTIGRLPAPAGQQYEALPMEHYRQVVRIEFADAKAAAAAHLAPLPLFSGYRMAYTCRWDDNNAEGDLRGVTAAGPVGVHGTCFLNGAGFGYTGMSTKDPGSKEIKAILATGSSIGNHSENHNLKGALGELPNNEQFRETYLPRAQREAQGDCPVMTVAPPHNRFGSYATMEHWRNSGHYGFANDGPGARGYSSNNVVIVRETSEPLQFFGSFHATSLKGDASLASAVEQWTEIGKDPQVWKATFSQYAAYRYQYYHTPIRKSVEGATAVFVLYRPELLDLNDPIPLTFAVRGVAASGVKAIRVEQGRAQRLDGAADEYRFNLEHDPARALPKRVGMVGGLAVEDDTPVSGIGAQLGFDGNAVRLKLSNNSEQAIRDLVVSYRFPHGWSAQVLRIRCAEVPAGSQWSDSATMTPPADAELRKGRLMLGAQLDFRLGNDPVRLHVIDYVEKQ